LEKEDLALRHNWPSLHEEGGWDFCDASSVASSWVDVVGAQESLNDDEAENDVVLVNIPSVSGQPAEKEPSWLERAKASAAAGADAKMPAKSVLMPSFSRKKDQSRRNRKRNSEHDEESSDLSTVLDMLEMDRLRPRSDRGSAQRRRAKD